MKKILVIVMTADQNYILQTRVAIWTMLHFSKRKIFFFKNPYIVQYEIGAGGQG